MLRFVTTLIVCSLGKCFSRAFILIPYRSGIIPALTRSRKLHKSTIVYLSTKRRGMPKKGKVNIPRSDQQVQQRAESQTQEGKDGISSVVSATKDGKICLKILAKPGAKQSNVTDISVDGVGVQIGAPAREGEANEELLRYLSEILGVRKRSISLDKGSKSRQKVVMIDSAEITVEQVREKLSREASQD